MKLYNRNMPHLPAVVLRDRFGGALPPYPSFAVLRHPLDRFLSAWRFTVLGGTDIMLASRFERWRLGPLEPLDVFVDRLAANPALMRIALQFCPQTDFITDHNGNLLPDHLFAFNRNDELPDALTNWLRLQAIPCINETRQLPVDLDERSKQRILALYRKDLALYEHVHAAGGSLQTGHASESEWLTPMPEAMAGA